MSESEEFRTLWKTLAQRETIADQLPGKTILPAAEEGKISRSKYTPLPIFTVEGEKPAQFALGDVIGEGGMGRIQLAVQVPLGRQVAVKSIRPEKLSDATTRELLREAWMTGALEHPNIVPVYALGESDGGPMLVMKRIEGTSWATYLASPQRLQADKNPRDLHEWHIETLLQVCQAIKFAHSKGIVHRDLKPENVMIGPFGEVYVLDWGIAVSLIRDDTGRLPVAADVQCVAGTPHYMAPEMAEAKGERISEQTDVYLLGAMLHEIITGEPRHRGETLYEILMSAYKSLPAVYDRSVPSELATICNTACQRLPEERYDTVAAFEEALRQYVNHRSSLQLAVEAQSSLRALLEKVEVVGDDDETTNIGGIYNLFGACRFGFQQARREWRENPDAAKGLQLAVETMIRFELRQGNPRAAERLLADLLEPRVDLGDEIAEQLAKLRAEEKELARMRMDLDLSIGTRTRAFLTFVIGTIFLVIPTGYGLARNIFGYRMALREFWFVGLLFFFIVLALLYWARDTLSKTETNRRVTRSVIAICAVSLVGRTSSWMLGLEINTAMVIETVVFAMGLSVSVSTIDTRLVRALPPMLIGVLIAPLVPRWAFVITSAGVFVTMLTIVAIWRPEELFPEDHPRRVARRLAAERRRARQR